MQRILLAHIVITAAILLSACVTLAPGADQVRITNKASDVGTCKALGNIQVPKNNQGLVDGASAQNQFRNQAVGLGSNVALVTEGFVSIPVAGIALSLRAPLASLSAQGVHCVGFLVADGHQGPLRVNARDWTANGIMPVSPSITALAIATTVCLLQHSPTIHEINSSSAYVAQV